MSESSDEKLAADASSARVVHMAEQFIFPFLDRRIQVETEQMSATFSMGKDCTHHVALVSALILLKQELDLVVRKGDQAAMKLHKRYPTSL